METIIAGIMAFMPVILAFIGMIWHKQIPGVIGHIYALAIWGYCFGMLASGALIGWKFYVMCVILIGFAFVIWLITIRPLLAWDAIVHRVVFEPELRRTFLKPNGKSED